MTASTSFDKQFFRGLSQMRFGKTRSAIILDHWRTGRSQTRDDWPILAALFAAGLGFSHLIFERILRFSSPDQAVMCQPKPLFRRSDKPAPSAVEGIARSTAPARKPH